MFDILARKRRGGDAQMMPSDAFLSLAVIKSRLSTPLPKFAMSFNFLPALIIDASMVSLIHGINISTFKLKKSYIFNLYCPFLWHIFVEYLYFKYLLHILMAYLCSMSAQRSNNSINMQQRKQS